jgi:SAM-dependent methyltransferase
MNKTPFNKISDYYNNLVEKYGHDPRSCDYGHTISQQNKFTVLSSCIDYSNKSVLDIGCGFADYADFLNKKYTQVEYHGVDISPAMIDEAKKMHPELSLEVRNVFEDTPQRTYDIVTANGIFYLLGEHAWGLMKEFITKMYALSNDVVAFNSLSSWTTDKEPGEFYADPIELLTFCRTLSAWVTIRHDYHQRDFTIFIYKQQHV